jgi:hypothetical protein
MTTLQVLGIIGDDNWLRFRRLYTPNHGKRGDYTWRQLDVDQFVKRLAKEHKLPV